MDKTDLIYYMVQRIIEQWQKVKVLNPGSCLYDDEWVRRMTGTFTLYTQCCLAIQEFESYYPRWRKQVFSPLNESICYGSFYKLQDLAKEISQDCIALNPCNAPIAYPVLLSYHLSQKDTPSFSSLVPNHEIQIMDYRSNITHLVEQFQKEEIEHIKLFNIAVQSLDVKRLQMDVVRAILNYAQMFYFGLQDCSIIRNAKCIEASEPERSQIKNNLEILKNDMNGLLKRQIESIEKEYTQIINTLSPSFVTPSSYSDNQYWQEEMNSLLPKMAEFDTLFVESKKMISKENTKISVDAEKLVRLFYHNDKAEAFFPLFTKYYYLFSMISHSEPQIMSEVERTEQVSQNCDIYISYNWEKDSNNAANHLAAVLDHNGIKYLRDKKDCFYRDNIKEFMMCLRAGKKIIIFLSKPYLESSNCMFELSGVMESDDYKNRLFPIIVDPTIRDDHYYVELVHCWEDKIKKLHQEITDIERISKEQAKPLKEKEKECRKVFEFLSKIKSYIDYTNSPSYDQMSENNFRDILNGIITEK